MKKLKKISIILLLIMSLFLLTACNSNEEKNEAKTTSSAENKTETSNEDIPEEMMEAYTFVTDLQKLTSDEIIANAEKQMAEPEAGETIAIMHIKDYGDIKIKFFEDVAPKACENFITHSKEGYYDGLTFHRVIQEFMIQGGDPLGNGTGGESIWGEDFGEELDASILPYKGSLCMASGGTGTSSIGSQFFITQANYKSMMESYLTQSGFSNVIEAYKQNNGDIYTLALYAQYTTFGQVFEGIEIVDKIAEVETNPENDKPLEDVVIESIEITTY